MAFSRHAALAQMAVITFLTVVIAGFGLTVVALVGLVALLTA